MQPADPRLLRVNDAEREHVIGLLQRATGHGYLDLDEFTERVDRALAARTRGELNAVLLDLPGLVHADHGAAAPAAPRAPAPPPQRVTAVPAGGGLEIGATLSTVRRRGRWEVPERLAVRTTMGSAELDLTEAVLAGPTVTVELAVVAGSVDLRVPADAVVEPDAVHVVLGEVTVHRRRITGGGGPRIVLTGTVRAGSVDVRGPRRRWWRARP